MSAHPPAPDFLYGTAWKEERTQALVDANAEEVYEQILASSQGQAIVIGIGNIVGFGEEIVTHITNRGREYAY